VAPIAVAEGGEIAGTYRPPAIGVVLQTTSDALVRWIEVRVALDRAGELIVQRVGERAARGKNRSRLHDPGQIRVEGEVGGEGTRGRPYQGRGVNDVPTPDRGEEDAGAQIDRVGNAEVQIEPFDGRRLPMVLDPTGAVDVEDVGVLELGEEAESRHGLPDHEEAQIIETEAGRLTLVADERQARVATEREPGIADAEASPRCVAQGADRRRPRRERDLAGLDGRHGRVGSSGGRRRGQEGCDRERGRDETDQPEAAFDAWASFLQASVTHDRLLRLKRSPGRLQPGCLDDPYSHCA